MLGNNRFPRPRRSGDNHRVSFVDVINGLLLKGIVFHSYLKVDSDTGHMTQGHKSKNVCFVSYVGCLFVLFIIFPSPRRSDNALCPFSPLRAPHSPGSAASPQPTL